MIWLALYLYVAGAWVMFAALMSTGDWHPRETTIWIVSIFWPIAATWEFLRRVLLSDW